MRKTIIIEIESNKNLSTKEEVALKTALEKAIKETGLTCLSLSTDKDTLMHSLIQEAEFRIKASLDAETLEQLSEEDISGLSESIASEFLDKDIFDYDYMDDIVREELEEYLES